MATAETFRGIKEVERMTHVYIALNTVLFEATSE